MAQHAKFSPSAAARWTACHGSVALCAKVPDKSSPAAREGSFAHAVAERCLVKHTYAESFLGETWAIAMDDTGGTEEFTLKDGDPLLGHVNDYVDYVWGLEKLYGGTVQVEQKVRLTDDIWGRADAILLSSCGTKLHVIDFKYGQGVIVEPEGNLQMLSYAGGALHNLSLDQYTKVEDVDLRVYQPRTRDGEPSKSATVTPEDVSLAALDMQTHVKRIQSGDRTLKTGAHCQFCDASAICPARKTEVQDIAKTTFSPNPLAGIAELSTSDMSRLLEAAPRVKSYLDALQEHALGLLESGTEIPGYKLVNKASIRRWGDEASVLNALTHLPSDAIAPRKLLSPAQLEKLLKKLGWDKDSISQSLAPHIHRKTPGRAVAPLTDPRSPCKVSNPFTPLPKDIL